MVVLHGCGLIGEHIGDGRRGIRGRYHLVVEGGACDVDVAHESI